MVATKHLSVIVLAILIAITVFNFGVVVNFAASGQGLLASVSTETVFLIAAVEFVAVLLAYIFHKQQAFPAQA